MTVFRPCAIPTPILVHGRNGASREFPPLSGTPTRVGSESVWTGRRDDNAPGWEVLIIPPVDSCLHSGM